jgi:hypothetical protein
MDKPQRLGLLSLIILLLSLQPAAQQRPPRPPPSEFNIELINLEGSSVKASVPGAGVRTRGYTAQTRLRRINSWKPSEEVPMSVAALRVGFWLENVAVRVEVTAYLGPSGHYWRPWNLKNLRTAKVASHLVRENETVTIGETERFGIEPFMVKLVRAGLWNGSAEIVNKTQALTVTSVAAERPVFTVTVRNVSHKHIDAIRWYGLENGRQGRRSELSGTRRIVAGGVFEIREPFSEKTDATVVVPQREIVIAAILFDDGTFEGEPDAAAEMAARLTGLRIQLLKAIQLIKSISPAPTEDQAAVLSGLKREVASWEEEIDPQIADELSARFANASEDMRKRRVKEELNNSLRLIKQNLLQDIEKFDRLNESAGNAKLGKWLLETIENLERRLSSN